MLLNDAISYQHKRCCDDSPHADVFRSSLSPRARPAFVGCLPATLRSWNFRSHNGGRDDLIDLLFQAERKIVK